MRTSNLKGSAKQEGELASWFPGRNMYGRDPPFPERWWRRAHVSLHNLAWCQPCACMVPRATLTAVYMMVKDKSVPSDLPGLVQGCAGVCKYCQVVRWGGVGVVAVATPVIIIILFGQP